MSGVNFGVDLSASEFRIDGATAESDYEVRDRDETTLLRVRRERPRDEYTFEDSHGKPVFTITNGDSHDVTGDHALVEKTTGRPVVALTKSSSMLHENWKVEVVDAETKTVHVGGIKLPGVLNWLLGSGRKYTIVDSASNVLGNVSKRRSGELFATVDGDGENDGHRQAVVAGTLAVAVLGDD